MKNNDELDEKRELIPARLESTTDRPPWIALLIILGVIAISAALLALAHIWMLAMSWLAAIMPR